MNEPATTHSDPLENGTPTRIIDPAPGRARPIPERPNELMNTSPELPRGWPVLVTGASGFVGGHVARELAQAGFRVRAFTRRGPESDGDDSSLEWFRGDLTRANDRIRAIQGMKGIVHVASWVSLGFDPKGESRRVNVDATRDLLDRCAGEGVERFVYTSSLWTVAAGDVRQPADESSAWNLETVRSPYCDSKREAESLVRERNGPTLRTSVICPGLVIGPRDRGPTSTRLFLTMARSMVVFLPGGGIPVVDARVLARAHRLVLERGEPGARYVVAGPYLAYREMAKLTAKLTGRPRWVVPIPDRFEPLVRFSGRILERASGGRLRNVSEAVVAGGFLRLHVTGAMADRELELRHPAPIESIRDALEHHRRTGHARGLARVRGAETS